MNTVPSVDAIQEAAKGAAQTLHEAAGTAGSAVADVFGDTVDTVGDALEGREREIGIGAVALVAAALVVGFLMLKALRSVKTEANGNAGGGSKKAPTKKKVGKKAVPAKR